MPVVRIGVTIDDTAVDELDSWVRAGRYPNRSRAVQATVASLRRRESDRSLERECAKLDPEEEQALADEGLRDPWPD